MHVNLEFDEEAIALEQVLPEELASKNRFLASSIPYS
jgi:hypothetical protein